MKCILAGIFLLALAACQSSGTTTAADPQSHTLGDTGIHVSGSVEAGGSATAR